jgi:hypothetical protein
MARTGVVVYDDDPHPDASHPRHSAHPRGVVFRRVFLMPWEDESVLDDPKWWDGNHCDSNACECYGIDPRRKGRLIKQP